ncbi:MAG: hypothetical protein HRT88_22645 [Lentisphaeraceae bacterium]|nr:hypothetical protein [Lentisphaeraceae bacterium]
MNNFQSGETVQAPDLDLGGEVRRVIAAPEVDRTEDIVRPRSGPVDILPYSPGQGPELFKYITIRGSKFILICGRINRRVAHNGSDFISRE